MGKRTFAALLYLFVVSTFAFFAKDAHAYTAEYKQVLEAAEGEPVFYDVWIDNDKMRMDTVLGGEKRVMLVREDGVFAYLPDRKTYTRLGVVPKWPVGARNPVDFGKWLKDREKERLGAEVVNGYPCDVFRFRDDQSGSIVTAWIWQGNDFPVKIVLAGGLVESTASFRDIKLDQPISPEVFQIPADAKEYNPNSLGAMFDAMMQTEEQVRDDNSAQIY